MTLIQTVILAIIEGITEFLPISSTGHMILAASLLRIPESDFVKSFEIIIQLGAILAVLILYFPKFIRIKNTWKPLFFSFIPAAVVGFIGYKLIKHLFIGNPYIVMVSLFIGGIIMILIDKYLIQRNGKYEQMTAIQSVIIGLFQAISVIPGVSRSAASIIGGLSVGLTKKEAVEFSFLLAVPTMIAATTLDLIQTGMRFNGPEIETLAVGLIVTFITAVIAVKTFIAYVQKHNFTLFGIYRIIISIVSFLTLNGLR
jgi:undecaprenyl-diphosphatase